MMLANKFCRLPNPYNAAAPKPTKEIHIMLFLCRFLGNMERFFPILKRDPIFLIIKAPLPKLCLEEHLPTVIVLFFHDSLLVTVDSNFILASNQLSFLHILVQREGNSFVPKIQKTTKTRPSAG